VAINRNLGRGLATILGFADIPFMIVVHFAVLIVVHFELFGFSRIYEEDSVIFLFIVEVAIGAALFFTGIRTFRIFAIFSFFWFAIFALSWIYFAWHSLTR
jgi:hypothetical protein